MKHSLLFLMAWCWMGMPCASAQTATDVNEGVHVTADGLTGAQVLTWWGKSGRTYFVQQSFDLINWTYVPHVETGTEAVSGLNFSCTDARQFWRLKYTDVSTGGLSAGDADFDGDGRTNQEELDGGVNYGTTDPFAADTDGDGINDGQEIAEGTDPKNSGSNSTLLLGLRVFTQMEAAP